MIATATYTHYVRVQKRRARPSAGIYLTLLFRRMAQATHGGVSRGPSLDRPKGKGVAPQGTTTPHFHAHSRPLHCTLLSFWNASFSSGLELLFVCFFSHPWSYDTQWPNLLQEMSGLLWSSGLAWPLEKTFEAKPWSSRNRLSARGCEIDMWKGEYLCEKKKKKKNLRCARENSSSVVLNALDSVGLVSHVHRMMSV